MNHQLEKTQKGSHLKNLQRVLCGLRGPLMQLNRHKYADIYAQQIKARKELTGAQVLLQHDPFNKDLQ